MLSRRHFLKGSSLAALSLTGIPQVAQPADRFYKGNYQKPRHIIHMVADGMSMGTLTGGHHFSNLLRQRGLTWIELISRPTTHNGLMDMRSLNSLVTDSAAASSSWGSGTRIINGKLNQMSDGSPLKTIYELFGEAGWKRGLVTTTEITHATPAGFATSVADRGNAQEIAAQYLERKIDVLLGGGRKFFQPGHRDDQRDLHEAFRRAGYAVIQERKDLQTMSRRQRWLGTFAEGHLPFTIDQRFSPELQWKVPTLAEMTRAALGKLAEGSPFILQVEGGRVDHACHNCDAASALNDMVAFDEAIDVCLQFQRNNPDTLLVITTDHGNGNLGLNATGNRYALSTERFQNLLKVQASFETMMNDLKRPPTEEEKSRGLKDKIHASPEEVVNIIEQATGYPVPLSKAALFAPFLSGKGQCIFESMNTDMAQLGQVMGNYLAIGWTGHDHTADYVPITAIGPGSEHFQGLIQSTQVFDIYTSQAGIDYRNPDEPLTAENRIPDGPGMFPMEQAEACNLA